MDQNEIPEHWKRIQVDRDDLEIPWSKTLSKRSYFTEQTHAIDAFENPEGIQVIQKQYRHQSDSRKERGGEPMIAVWIDIVDAQDDERETLFTSPFLESDSLDADSCQYMNLISSVRSRSLSSIDK